MTKIMQKLYLIECKQKISNRNNIRDFISIYFILVLKCIIQLTFLAKYPSDVKISLTRFVA
jgi:hypothetical protein